ncbi:UNVERIFIED_CONTAM: hypothetical protein PYX00_007422 [Menopon gallinae]|uniref:Uncharacterized protein n=1 Tax=Menopon gallinae TaxID=328185 RepID=A0AAW2HJ62_9NEOP
MVLHMVDLVSSHDVFYEDCPQSGGSFTGLEDFNMNHCLNTTTMIPGKRSPETFFRRPGFFPIPKMAISGPGRARGRGEERRGGKRGGEGGKRLLPRRKWSKAISAHCFAEKKQTTR